MSRKIQNYYRGEHYQALHYSRLSPVYHRPGKQTIYTHTQRTDIKISSQPRVLKIRQRRESFSTSFSKKMSLIKDRYDKRSRSLITLSDFLDRVQTFVSWAEKNKNLFERIGKVFSSFAIQLDYYFGLISPLIRITILFRLQSVSSDLQRNIEQIQHQYQNLYSKHSVSTSYKLARERINHLQLLALKKKAQLKRKIIQLLVTALPFFTYTAFVALKLVSNSIAKPIYKLFVTSIKELINLYATLSNLKSQHKYTSALSTDLVIDKTVQASQTGDEASQLIRRLQRCRDIESVKRRMKEAQVDLIVPNHIGQFQHLLRTERYKNLIREKFEYGMTKSSLLTRTFQYRLSNQPNHKPYVDGDHVNRLLEKRQREAEQKIVQLKVEIRSEIRKCLENNDIDLPTIIQQLKEKGIQLESDDMEIEDIEELDELVENDHLIHQLAATKLSAIEAEAHSLQQAVRQTLLVKHQLERAFFLYAIFDSLANMALAVAQFISSYFTAVGAAPTVVKFIEFLISDLIQKTGLGPIFTFFTFISSLTFQVARVILAAMKFAFSRHFKPNEYSFEGQKYELLLNWYKLSNTMYKAYYISKKVFVYLNHATVKRLARRPIDGDKYAVIKANKEHFNIKIKEQTKVIGTAINRLKLKDFDRALFSHTNGRSQNQTNINAVETIQSTLASGNIQYYPQEIVEFLNRHLSLGIREGEEGTALTEIDASHLSWVNDLYTANADQFIEQVKDSEISHYFPSQA